MPPPSAPASDAPLTTADLRFAPVPKPIIDRIWPATVVVLGLGLTAAWTCLLGYGLVKLIKFLF